ncbi:MAG: DUF1553 domain-containing protein [Planctomyces sp.]|nr:DUF1553 domain-containing protein [Planctomyces sp.]
MTWRKLIHKVLFVIVLCLTPVATVVADEPIDYLRQIKPILRERCFACHGALKQEAKLRLDTATLANRGGESGAAVEPGNSEASLILQRILAQNESERMPPKHEGEPLTTEQVRLLRHWIDSGAKGPADELPEADPEKHWAFQPIVRPEVPQLATDWVRNPIDAFLAQRHQQQGIQPQPEASRIVLLRRLHLDLIGIPPTPEELAAFESDSSTDWYEKAVQRLVNDPRHGERWARHWMDIWRYSDWWGLGDQLRNSQKHIWHWRDWIVESLNNDTPYDEMVKLMLAADELHPNDLNKLRATGYLARNYWLFNRPQWMEETVEHVSKGFLGLTMNCSRCHDHKYDPLGQTDYYRFRAFFEPYHVRMDVLPGEADLARNGIPRAFDGLLEEPTYLYIRGDERNPDKSQVITPGIPSILAFDELRIEPVSLPVEAWQPERRPWVLDAYLSASKSRVTASELALKRTQEKVAAATQNQERLLSEKQQQELHENTDGTSESSNKTVLLTESFETLNTTRWKLFGGDWVHEPGRLLQKLDGATRSVIRLNGEIPEDFDATIRFKILGGSQWRSVGISFDAHDNDPSQPPSSTDSEQSIYVSAVTGGSKIQAAFHSDGVWQYPAGTAVRSIPVNLNEEYTLRVQVRGSLINASLNGTPMIALESLIQRRNGAFQVTTFDAIAAFHTVSIEALDPKVVMITPETLPLAMATTPEMAQAAVAEALGERQVAEASLAMAQAELESVERRIAAQRAEWSSLETARQEYVVEAVRSERMIEVFRSRHRIATAELGLLRASADQKEAAEKALNEAREAHRVTVQAAEAEVKPDESFTRFTGGVWTPTRFFNSLKDDPEVKFQPQSSGRRTALASWITDRRNPLTARVAVNHIWMRHMGQPLVPTVFDFGRKGTPPDHPELLDWLASELVDSGWSMKHVHTLITQSAAYRMSSSTAGAESAIAQDPENHLWWRRSTIRLESQLVRDSLLALAGTLDPARGGPPVPVAEQDVSKRRSLYFFHSNNERNLFLTTFDEALVKDCYRREQSIVPQQALALSNSQIALDSAEQIAAQLTKSSENDGGFIRNAFRTVVGIEPTPDEVAASLKALNAWRSLPDGTNASARTNFVWALINHNDFVTLR